MVTSCCLSLKDGTCRYKDEEMCTHIRCLLGKTLLQQFDTGLPHLAEDSKTRKKKPCQQENNFNFI